jgi:hypothetical protein
MVLAAPLGMVPSATAMPASKLVWLVSLAVNGLLGIVPELLKKLLAGRGGPAFAAGREPRHDTLGGKG